MTHLLGEQRPLSIGEAASPYDNIHDPGRWAAYNKASARFREVISQERLIVIDSQDGPTLSSLERGMRYIRQKHPEKKMLVICDKCIVTF